MKRSLFAALLLTGAVTGCDKKDAAKEAAPTASAAVSMVAPTATATAKADAGSPAAAGTSTALAHLPEKCGAVVRLDIAGALAIPKVKAQLGPALEELKKKTDGDGKGFGAFIADTGLDPAADFKEVAMCITDLSPGAGAKDPNFVVVIAGNFKPGTVVPALEKTAKADKFKVEEFAGTKIAADVKGEMFLGQAPDGVVVVARKKEQLEASFKGGGDARKFGIPLDAALALVMPGDALKGLMAGDPTNPFAAQSDKITKAMVVVDLKKPALEGRIAMSDDKSATELAGAAKMILGQLSSAPPPPPGDPSAVLFGAMKSAKIDSKGSDVILTIEVPQEGLDGMLKDMAQGMAKGPGATAPGSMPAKQTR